MHISKWKESIREGYLLYDSSIWYTGKGKNYGDKNNSKVESLKRLLKLLNF